MENGGFYDRAEVNKRIRALSEQYGLQIDPDARTGDLPVGLQQRVTRREDQLVPAPLVGAEHRHVRLAGLAVDERQL